MAYGFTEGVAFAPTAMAVRRRISPSGRPGVTVTALQRAHWIRIDRRLAGRYPRIEHRLAALAAQIAAAGAGEHRFGASLHEVRRVRGRFDC